MGSHVFGFLGQENCSYLRLANVPDICTVGEK